MSKSQSRVMINGIMVYEGSITDVSVAEETLIVDGTKIKLEQIGDNMNIEVKIIGDVHTLAVEHGDVSVDGNVTGSLYCGQNIACNDVNGDVEAGGTFHAQM